jgi:pimeloyl-ACP methyl ester carboxylesterase
VLLHPLLLDHRFHRRTARRLAADGFRVVSLDLLGHGRSDHPTHASEHRMDVYAEQVVALLDHLDAGAAVFLGTSLGANVSLFVAVQHPERVRGLVLEMPVLEWALAPAALLFVPAVLVLHYAAPIVRWFGPDPQAVAAVLHGLMVGPVAPTVDARRAITAPALVLGHHVDLVHPFGDAERLAEVLPRGRLVEARSIFERAVRPGRLAVEIEGFVRSCRGGPRADRSA